MITGIRSVLFFTIVSLLFCFTQKSYSQAIPLLNDPIRVSEIEVFAEKLEMTTLQRESMLDVYDRYLDDFARVRNGEVRTFEDTLTEMAEQMGFMTLNIPERSEVEILISQANRAMKSIQRVDGLFFDEISGMLSEKQQRGLKHFKVSRQVDAYRIIAIELAGLLNRGARAHITELYDWLHVVGSAEIDLVLETYETRYLNTAKAAYNVLIETINIILEMIDELDIRGLDQQSLMSRFMNEEAIADLKVRGDILLKPLQEMAFKISQLNWKTWKQLDGALEVDDARTLQQLYYSKSYNDAIRGFKRIDGYFDRALKLEGINEDQRISLQELRERFETRKSQKSAKHAGLLEQSRKHRSIDQMSGKVAGEFDEQLEVASESRDELVESTENQIRNVIGKEHFEAMTDSKKNTSSKVEIVARTVGSSQSGSSVVIELEEVDRGVLLGGVEIPKPISPSFPKRASEVLGLDEGGGAIIEAIYDEYRESYDNVYKKIEQEGKTIADESELSIGQRINKTRDASNTSAEAVAALDTGFFNDLAAVTSLDREDVQLMMLEHHRLRQRNAAPSDPFGWGGGDGDAIDLVNLFVLSDDADIFLSELSIESVQVIDRFMHAYHESVSDLHSHLVKSLYELAHMQDAMMVISESENSAQMRTSIQKRWRDSFIELRDSKRAILNTNQMIVDELLGKLSENDYWIVRVRFVKKAYPEIFRDSSDATTILAAALAIQAIDATQRSQLEQLSSSYQYDYWNLCEEMIANRKSDASTAGDDKFMSKEDMHRSIQLESLRFKRSELNDRIRMRLRMILAESQIKEVPGLRTSVIAVRQKE